MKTEKNDLTEKDEEIIRMLLANASYSEIQKKLGVGPNRIVNIKKLYFQPNSTNDALSDTTECDYSAYGDQQEHIPVASSAWSSENSCFDSGNPGKSTPDSDGSRALLSNDGDKEILTPAIKVEPVGHYRSNAEIEFEKYKLQLGQELAKEQLNLKSRELNIRQQELYHKKLKENTEIEKKVGEKNLLLHKFQRLIERCEEGEWTRQEIEDLFDDAESLEEKIEDYGILNHEDVKEWPETKALGTIIDFFSFDLNDFEPDDVVEVEFDDRTREVIDCYN